MFGNWSKESKELKQAINGLIDAEVKKLSAMSKEELIRYYADTRVSVSQVYILLDATLSCVNDIVEQNGVLLSEECRDRLKLLKGLAAGQLSNS